MYGEQMIDTAAIREIIAAGNGAPVTMSPEIVETMLVAIDRGQAMERRMVNMRTQANLALQGA